jgi:hypothetical protein
VNLNADFGPVAQSVEQRIENPCVGGSIPPQATKFQTPQRLSGSGAFLRIWRIGNADPMRFSGILIAIIYIAVYANFARPAGLKSLKIWKNAQTAI